MSKQSELNLYIARLHGRLRVGAVLRGVAIFCFTALAVTVAAVLLLNRYAFPEHGVAGARGSLIGLLAVAAGLGLVWPLVRLTRGRAVVAAERAHPDLEQRLTTFYERGAENDPFRELLAADTLAKTEDAPPARIMPNGRLFALAGAGVACLGVLCWLIASGPGYMGYGASLLWRGAKKNVAPLYGITVAPGDVAIRRNSDQLVTAELTNLRPDKVQLFARFASGKGWEPVLMQANTGDAGTYHFLFAGLPENVEYYVAAGPLVSPHYRVRVVDLPSVKGIQVTYHYPKWTGMKAVTEEHSGDLRALEGTNAAIEVEMDRPLKDGSLTLDGGKTIQLKRGEGNKYTGDIRMEKDGAYHVAATDSGQAVRLSEDYFISTEKPTPPEVAIQRPGGDYRASPIEEVTIGVKAGASFGLKDMHLHYSVNGGPDKEVGMLKEPGVKSADGSYTLRLEDFKLVPGDLVSLYATARDGHAEARTEISFIQADPFEREFSQSQQSGGGGGGGGGGQQNQTEISKREKELIAATWKQENSKTATAKDASVAGQFLSDAQQKLRDQVLALSARMQSRDLSQANEEFTGFEKDMQDAAKAMLPSTDKLKGMEWKDAISLEQKALQSLLRAEATFRKIEVAFGQQQGGGGGGGGGAGRDLASLFDLELDTEKNQYETAQTASPQEKHDKDVADALEKLDALAKRQEELANQQKNPQQSFEQKWQQEMLRREAEQLQRQMEQMAQDKQGQQQGGQQSSSASSSSGPKGQSGQSGAQQASSSSSGSQGQGGSESSRQQQAGNRFGQQAASGPPKSTQDQRIQEATNRLRQAEEAMKRSSGSQSNADAARQAAERLREATSSLGGAQQQAASGKMDGLSREAGQMVEQERSQAERIDKLVKGQDGSASADPAEMTARTQARVQERNRLAAERQALSDRLSALQKGVRDAAREMASNQPDTAKKLRDALTEMDQSDLDNHVQRTADWLRRGVNPNSNGTEAEIAQGLQKLDQQLRQAQGGMGQGTKGQQRGSGQGDQTAVLGQVARLRGQLEAMAAGQQPGQNGQAGQPGRGQGAMDKNGQGGQQGPNGTSGANRQTGQLSRNGQGSQPGQNGPRGGQQQTSNNAIGGQGQQAGQARQRGQGQQAGQARQRGQGQQAGNGGNPGGAGSPGGSGNQIGDTRTGGGGVGDGGVWGNVNTGNNQYAAGGQRPAPADASGNPADTERSYQQSMRALSQLRQMIQGNPRAASEVQELTRQMQKLDPARFPGNPALVEQMHREVLSAVDRVELQLQRDVNQNEARTGRPQATPAGYEDAVAEYYKRLSKSP